MHFFHFLPKLQVESKSYRKLWYSYNIKISHKFLQLIWINFPLKFYLFRIPNIKFSLRVQYEMLLLFPLSFESTKVNKNIIKKIKSLKISFRHFKLDEVIREEAYSLIQSAVLRIWDDQLTQVILNISINNIKLII